MYCRILFVSIFFGLFIIQSSYGQTIADKNKLEAIEFTEGYNYASFTANDQYLAWGEFYTGDITLYNLSTKKTQTLKLTKGRGPHEYLFFTTLVLTADDRLVIGDPENIKFIIYDIKSGSFEKDIVFDDFKPYRAASNGSHLFALNTAMKTQPLYRLFDEKSWKTQDITGDGLSADDEYENLFKREGYIDVNDMYGVHLSRYYPMLYLTDIQKKQFIKEISFDVVETSEAEKGTLNGKKYFTPPRDPDILSKDVVFLPNSDSLVGILAEGKGEEREYSSNTIMLYDIIKDAFVKSIDLGIQATEMMTNGDHLFVFSKDEISLFQFKIELNSAGE
jgi:WD40 repeat protein